ncbi:hypothetical protein Hanom_Chr14g01331251 [Helianthus anomalus]
MDPLNGLTQFITSGYTRFRTRKNLYLGPKLVNTRLNARQCGDVKPAQFKDRTSDICLVSHHRHGSEVK